MLSFDSRLHRIAPGAMPGAVGLLAMAVAGSIIRPFDVAPIGFDTAASVLHFDRIVSGRRLESFVTTTPKPLLTLGDGLLHGVTGDWRFVTWAAILGFAAVVVLAAILARRAAGTAAGAFAGAALAGFGPFIVDVAASNAVVWAVLCWLLAALALTTSPRRYGTAGFLLMVAVLARLEGFVVVAIAAALVALLRVAPGIPATRRPPRRACLLLIGFLALPVMLAHDWLLTGDPWFWTTVSQNFSEHAAQYVMGPVALVRWLAARYAEMGPVVPLAAIGLADLAWRSRRSADAAILAAGIVAICAGILALLVLLAARGTYVSDRYPLPVDVTAVFTAGLGVGALVRAAVAAGRSMRERWAGAPESAAALPAEPEPRAVRALPADPPPVADPPPAADPPRAARSRSMSAAAALAPVAIGALAAVVALAPYGPFDPSTRSQVDDLRDMNAAADVATPVLRSAGYSISTPEARTLHLTYKDVPPPPTVVMPVLLRPRAAVDLGLPLWMVGSGTPVTGTGADATIAAPMVLMHLSRDDSPPARYRIFETAVPTQVGHVRIVPLLVKPAIGLWVVRLEPVP